MLRLVYSSAIGNATVSAATRWDIWTSRMREAMGGALNRVKAPGAVQPLAYEDPVTGDHIGVSVDSLFTVLSVNGRDYYFNRLSGEFDGTGMRP